MLGTYELVAGEEVLEARVVLREVLDAAQELLARVAAILLVVLERRRRGTTERTTRRPTGTAHERHTHRRTTYEHSMG